MICSSRTVSATPARPMTRRQAITGLLSTTGVSLLVTLGIAQETRARKKHRRKKKRCRNLGDTCTIGGARACCDGRTCSPIGLVNDPRTFCCQDNEAACELDSDCCGPSICDPGSKTCAFALSDRTAKTNFGSVDPADMLERVRNLPITTWNYHSDDASVRHIGPMAQDFAETFGLGADERVILPMDGQGVALAAIQGLASQVATLQAEQARLIAQIADLEAR